MYNFLKDKSVLYVEDELDVLENISTLLSNFFKHFYTVSDELSALELFDNNHIDLLLVDIELPKKNGIELIKKIRDADRNVMIIIISAYTRTDYLLESVEFGLSKYIVKPLTSKKIHALLNANYAQNDVICLSGDIEIDRISSVVKYDDQCHTLSRRELDFLVMLVGKKMIG